MGKKVLIAEDQPENRRLLEDLLSTFQGQDISILTAENGQEAIEKATEQHPDLLLLDVMMPKMDGFEVCKRIKADPDLAKTYVIMISAKFQQEDRLQAAVAGADEYITKPFEVDLVLERLSAVLGKGK